MHPHAITKQFEREIAAYCGSRYAVSTTSCTSAILLCCLYHKANIVEIPKFTYCGVAQSILNAGGKVTFRDEDWSGIYQLKNYNIYDAARRMTKNMYIPGSMMCLSLHISKILGVDQGGVILLDNQEAYEELKKMRFDGRSEGVHPKDDNIVRGHHCYLSPTVSAQALWRLSILPDVNPDIPLDDYPDLSKLKVFK